MSNLYFYEKTLFIDCVTLDTFCYVTAVSFQPIQRAIVSAGRVPLHQSVQSERKLNCLSDKSFDTDSASVT